MTYPVYWVPSPDFDRGRANPVLALVNHRIVGTLASADRTFTGSSRLVSSTFAVGYGCGMPGHRAGAHAHQYVYIDDTAWTNGDNRTSTGALVKSEWNAKYPTSLVNSRTITIEHHDNGHLPSGDPRRGVVPDAVADVAIHLWRTLLSGDLAAWKAAGIRWRNDTTAARVAAECRAIVPGPDTVIDHHYIAGSNKPYCWRPWAADAVGFPQARYLSALTGDDSMEIEAKHERWVLDGGPGKVTTIGAPIVNGKPDYSRRLALTSGSGDTNRTYRLLARDRLTEHSDTLNEPLYRALASYAMPAEDCTDEIAVSIAADRAKAHIVWG